MKRILFVVCLCLLGCDKQKSADERINEHKPPIVVVARGRFMSDCVVKLRDGEGNLFSIADNTLESVAIGDTLVFAQKGK